MSQFYVGRNFNSASTSGHSSTFHPKWFLKVKDCKGSHHHNSHHHPHHHHQMHSDSHRPHRSNVRLDYSTSLAQIATNLLKWEFWAHKSLSFCHFFGVFSNQGLVLWPCKFGCRCVSWRWQASLVGTTLVNEPFWHNLSTDGDGWAPCQPSPSPTPLPPVLYEVGSILLLKPVTLVEVDSSSKTVISDDSYIYICGQLCLVSGRIARIYLAKVFGQMAQKD